MDQASFNSSSQRLEMKQFPILPHLSRRESISDSIYSEDPLAGDAPTRSHSQSPAKQHPNASQGGAATPSGRSKFRVVLTRPLEHHNFQEVDNKDEGLVTAPVISDVTPRGRPKSLFKAINTAARQSPSGRSTTTLPSTAASTPPLQRGRGRPKGSIRRPNGQPNVTAAGSRQSRQVKPRSTPPTGFPKRRGRPPKQPSPPPRAVYNRANAPFFAFLCEWDGCRAELHNLETLRRHVYFVHGESVHCLWGKCRILEQPCEFDDDEGFKEHVEEVHLVPLSWHVGDGPSNSWTQDRKDGNEDEIPDYLKDKDGNQVTPSIKDQEEEDIVTYRNNRRKLKDLLIRMNENLPDESDGEIMDEDGA
ncbi:hypothetical protein ACJ41O_008467 [Fusarium nematophilum]